MCDLLSVAVLLQYTDWLRGIRKVHMSLACEVLDLLDSAGGPLQSPTCLNCFGHVAGRQCAHAVNTIIDGRLPCA